MTVGTTPSAGQTQRICFWEGYESAVRTGAKRQTIRVDDPFHPGPAELVFEKENGDVVILAAVVTGVRSTTRHQLNDADAQRDGFDTLADLQAALERHYPGLQPSSRLDVVAFELSER